MIGRSYSLAGTGLGFVRAAGIAKEKME